MTIFVLQIMPISRAFRPYLVSGNPPSLLCVININNIVLAACYFIVM